MNGHGIQAGFTRGRRNFAFVCQSQSGNGTTPRPGPDGGRLAQVHDAKGIILTC